jgi:hypothetical protein
VLSVFDTAVAQRTEGLAESLRGIIRSVHHVNVASSRHPACLYDGGRMSMALIYDGGLPHSALMPGDRVAVWISGNALEVKKDLLRNSLLYPT